MSMDINYPKITEQDLLRLEITDAEIKELGVYDNANSEPTWEGEDVTAVRARFDKLVREGVAPKFNRLLQVLTTAGADQIKRSGGGTVTEELDALWNWINNTDPTTAAAICNLKLSGFEAISGEAGIGALSADDINDNIRLGEFLYKIYKKTVSLTNAEARDYDQSSDTDGAYGSIKNKFDALDGEIAKIADGTLIVPNATNATNARKANTATNYESGNNSNSIDGKFNTIDTEIANIKNGSVTVSKSLTAKNYDTSTGTIKSKFDQIDTQFNNLVQGGTVKTAQNFDTTTGTIKRKFDEIDIALTTPATQIASGILSANDKKVIDSVSAILGEENGDSNAVVDKICEVLAIFQSYPEGNKIVDALAAKANTSSLGSLAKKNTIANVDISDSAAIAQSKISGLTSALSAKAALSSPTFTGTPKAPTATKGTNTTQVATTAFVQNAMQDAQDALTFDNTPTSGSTNPVTSGGVYTADRNHAGLRAGSNTYGHIKMYVQNGVLYIENN